MNIYVEDCNIIVPLHGIVLMGKYSEFGRRGALKVQLQPKMTFNPYKSSLVLILTLNLCVNIQTQI